MKFPPRRRTIYGTLGDSILHTWASLFSELWLAESFHWICLLAFQFALDWAFLFNPSTETKLGDWNSKFKPASLPLKMNSCPWRKKLGYYINSYLVMNVTLYLKLKVWTNVVFRHLYVVSIFMKRHMLGAYIVTQSLLNTPARCLEFFDF